MKRTETITKAYAWCKAIGLDPKWAYEFYENNMLDEFYVMTADSSFRICEVGDDGYTVVKESAFSEDAGYYCANCAAFKKVPGFPYNIRTRK